MRRIAWLVGMAGALYARDAVADTLGYLRTTPIHREHVLGKAKGPSRVVVARTPAEWRAAWKAAGGTGAAPAVDFEREMIVGVINAGKPDGGRGSLDGIDRVVYRIQLDNAAQPTALEVHLGSGDAPTWSGNTRKPTAVHFVVTPRSALAVRFVADEMVDGHMFDATNTGEGVESKPVATIAGVTASTKHKAALREQAEAAVVATLGPAERKQLLAGPLGGAMKRIPHGWTKLDVTRTADRWSIHYDELTFEVDVATGKVTRK
jgi:hypothetical protein